MTMKLKHHATDEILFAILRDLCYIIICFTGLVMSTVYMPHGHDCLHHKAIHPSAILWYMYIPTHTWI